MSSWSLLVLCAATALMMVDALRLKAGSDVQVGLHNEDVWAPISTTAACSMRGISYDYGSVSKHFDEYRNYTLEECKNACNADYILNRYGPLNNMYNPTSPACIAIDYFSVTKECFLYRSGCSLPLYKESGASSYGRRAPCDDHSCPTGYVLKPNAIGDKSDDATCCKRAWSVISTSATCRTNSEDIYPISQWYSERPKMTLELCKAECDANNQCVAIDFFSATGGCFRYDKACEKPLAVLEGASSYMHQGTQTTCGDYDCPSGYSRKADARNIVGQGRNQSACCEACPADNCACFARNAVLRNSAWRRLNGDVCKCTSGSSLHGGSEVCTGRYFVPARLQGKGCFCARD